MAEKREIEHVAGVKPDDGKTYLHTNIGFDRTADIKHEIYWLIPTTGIKEKLIELSEECQDRYNCDIPTLLESAVRQLTTRPDYKIVGFNEDGTLKEGGHAAMQEMADGYKVGARVAGEGVKSKARKLDTMVTKYGGGSQDQLEAKLAKMEKLEKEGLL